MLLFMKQMSKHNKNKLSSDVWGKAARILYATTTNNNKTNIIKQPANKSETFLLSINNNDSKI